MKGGDLRSSSGPERRGGGRGGELQSRVESFTVDLPRSRKNQNREGDGSERRALEVKETQVVHLTGGGSARGGPEWGARETNRSGQE